jgi:hypothetical protein
VRFWLVERDPSPTMDRPAGSRAIKRGPKICRPPKRIFGRTGHKVDRWRIRQAVAAALVQVDRAHPCDRHGARAADGNGRAGHNLATVKPWGPRIISKPPSRLGVLLYDAFSRSLGP